MDVEDPASRDAAAELERIATEAAGPRERPGLVRFLWYSYGGSLPARYRLWVLHDITCPTWWLRHFARSMMIIIPFLAIYFAAVPASMGLLLLSGLTFAGAIFMFLLVNVLVDTDRRMVRAGYRANLASDLRSHRSVQAHRAAAFLRRERIAQRQAQRSARR